MIFVGFGSPKASNQDFVARIVNNTGASALVVDLSGHGESPFDINDTTPAQHLLEATFVYDWLRQKHPASDISVMGTSYGGFVAAYLTRFRKVEKLVLRTPAIYEPSLLYTKHRNIDKILAREYRGNSEIIERHPLFLQSAAHEPSTLLVVHENDESVPPQTTDAYCKIFKAARYTAKGFAHAFRDPSNPQNNIDEYYAVISSQFI